MKKSHSKKVGIITGVVLSAATVVTSLFAFSSSAFADLENKNVAKKEVKTGWHYNEKEKGYEYYGKDGVKYTGWRYMGENENERTPHWSYFGNGGVLYTGWRYMSEKEGESTPHFSYFGNNGWLRTNWQWMDEREGESEPHFSYFGNNGWLRTGWQHFEDHKSYFGNNGHLVTDATFEHEEVRYVVNGRGWVVNEEPIIKDPFADIPWQTGIASAYGGSTDPSSGSVTANGSRVTESSLGVAIPLAWNRRDLLGHQVQIEYNGKIIVATINDLGGMNGGRRALDLQPGIFRGFGFNSANGWGLRTVKYRIL